MHKVAMNTHTSPRTMVACEMVGVQHLGGTWHTCQCRWTSLVAQTVKRLPTMWETRVQLLGQEDLLEKEVATHSSILAWKIPWTDEPSRLQSLGPQRAGHN